MHCGPWAGIAPTGRSVTVPWLLVTRFDGDRIAWDYEAFDSLPLMEQLGAAPLAASPGATR